jgi:hypothetical protein
MTTQAENTEDASAAAGEKLYANKFKTVEELEAGYKNSLPTFQENETLKTQLKELTEVPTTYLRPADIEIDANREADIQARAKETGLTQKQYEAFLRADKARLDAHKTAFENNRKEVGEETLNLLTDYVSKNYPKELADNMLNTFIQNKDARTAALNHRSQLLNNQVPGMQKTAPPVGYTVTQADIKKAYDAKEANRADMKAQQHYLNLLDQLGQQQRAG